MIGDNGEGFTENGVNAFCEYGTEHKAEIGCKGVGRLTFLKVFGNVEIESQTSRHLVKVDFDESFDRNKIKTEIKESNEPFTVLTFSQSRPSYKDKKVIFYELIDRLRLHLMPLLYLQRIDRPVDIEFEDENANKLGEIRSVDIPEFEEKEFDIREEQTNDKKLIPFKLYINIEPTTTTGKINAFYVADRRTVSSFNKHDLTLDSRPGSNITLLLTSPYLDERVNDERDDFLIFNRKEDLLAPISWERINRSLSKCLSEVFQTKFPELEIEYKEFVEAVTEDHLHLASYLEVNPLSGTKGIERSLKKAEEAYSADKRRFFRKLKKDESPTKEQIEEAANFAGRELVDYIQTRDALISKLEMLSNDKEKSEQILHDLILRRGNEGETLDPLSNNLWLIDDRFMGYSYAASDKQIRKVMEGLGKGKDPSKSQKEPDLSVFFQDDNENHSAVIVELKPFSENADNKFAGLKQLRGYAKEFRKEEGLDQVWYYLITDVDNEFATALVEDDFQLLFSVKENVFFRYYEAIGLYLYVISAQSMISDARARNKTFIEMIRKHTNPLKRVNPGLHASTSETEG